MISVIITTYNNENYIEQALNSLFEQTYKDIEIIIVDDGSTDNTRNVLSAYQDRIRYFHKPNGGEASARNAGLTLAQGEYIAFLDADDLYKPDKLEKQLEVFQCEPSTDIVYNDIEVVNENLEYLSTLKSEGIYDKREDFLCMLLVRQIIPATASMMFKRKCIEQGIRYPEQYKHAVDYGFTIKLAHYFKFKYLEEPLYIYRRHAKNLTNSHVKQVAAEVDIVRSLGLNNIKKIVDKANLEQKAKCLVLARIMMKINEWVEAKRILMEFVQRYNSPQAWFYLGNCFYNEGIFTEAINSYQKALEFDADMAEAYNNLACVYGKKKLYDKAIAFSKQALSLRKEYMDAIYNVGQAMECADDYKITTRELRKVLTVY